MKKFNVNVNGTVYSVEVEEVGGTVAAAPVAPAAPAALRLRTRRRDGRNPLLPPCERPEREPPRQSGVRAVLFAGRKGKRRRDTDHPEL